MKWYWLTLLSMMIGGIVFFGMGQQNLDGRARLEVPKPLQSQSAGSRSQMQGIKLIEQSDQSTAWEILAENAEFSEDAKVAVARGVRAQLFQDDTVLLSLQADRSTVQRTTGDIDMQGDVRVVHQDGYTMTTDSLHWQAESRQLHTDEAVALEGPSVRVTGTGLQSDVDQQRFHLENNVHASFQIR